MHLTRTEPYLKKPIMACLQLAQVCLPRLVHSIAEKRGGSAVAPQLRMSSPGGGVLVAPSLSVGVATWRALDRNVVLGGSISISIISSDMHRHSRFGLLAAFVTSHGLLVDFVKPRHTYIEVTTTSKIQSEFGVYSVRRRT